MTDTQDPPAHPELSKSRAQRQGAWRWALFLSHLHGSMSPQGWSTMITYDVPLSYDKVWILARRHVAGAVPKAFLGLQPQVSVNLR